jgi:hypothetical protein
VVGGPPDASFAALIKTSRRCLGSLILKNARSSLSISRSEGPLNFPFSIGPRKAVAASPFSLAQSHVTTICSARGSSQLSISAQGCIRSHLARYACSAGLDHRVGYIALATVPMTGHFRPSSQSCSLSDVRFGLKMTAHSGLEMSCPGDAYYCAP